MPRDLVIGNGALLVNLDKNMNIRDLYYPHVGLHNHVSGYRNRVGVWADGHFSWLDDTWSVRLAYRPRTLTTQSQATNGRLGITLTFNDTVHHELNLLLRHITVENHFPDEREIRLFFHHDFRIYETDIGDTVFFHPFSGSMIHYKRDCYILINGASGDEGIYQYASGVKEFGAAEGTWRDAEDGVLSMHPIEQGSVDSTVSFRLIVGGNGQATVDCWLAVGRSLDEVLILNTVARNMSADALIQEADAYWNGWLNTGDSACDGVPPSVADLYQRSLLILQTQIDRCGGIVAANDTDIMETARAHYSYIWPRDGAFVSRALDLAGYPEPSRRFFSFCAGLLPPERPFFLQKYCPDGTFGATWHPWISNGIAEIPCQQDSTALVIWAIGKHAERWKDKEFVSSLYDDLIAPAADHMSRELDSVTKLPRASYDLWEQTRAIHLFTCCAVFGALTAAMKLSRVFDPRRAGLYSETRDTLKRAIIQNFFDPRLNRFVRSLQMNEGESCYRADLTIDSSMSGLFLFDLLPANDPRVVATMHAIYDRLWVRTPIGGLARYEDDYYFQVSSDVKNVPGNPWLIPTLWMAEWYIAVAQNTRDLEPAMDLIQWATKHASEAGLLPEQVHPYTGRPLAVMPLTWSHAAYVTAVQRYIARVRELAAQQADKT